MNTFSLRIIALLPALFLCSAAFAGVTVNFIEPARFTDMPYTQAEKDTVLQDLRRHLTTLGEKWLPAGQELKIDVLDIDLAGRIRLNAGRDIRVLNGGADWPMIEVRYTLESGGKTLKSSSERIADMNYFQSHVQSPSQSRESLYYEKRMLEDWFRKNFAKQSQ